MLDAMPNPSTVRVWHMCCATPGPLHLWHQGRVSVHSKYACTCAEPHASHGMHIHTRCHMQLMGYASVCATHAGRVHDVMPETLGTCPGMRLMTVRAWVLQTSTPCAHELCQTACERMRTLRRSPPLAKMPPRPDIHTIAAS